MHDFMKANYEFFERIYYEFSEKNKLKFEECIKIFTSIGVSAESAKFCYGMSKMTVAMDSHNNQFYTMEFVEFLEMVCRIADKKFRGTEMANMELQMKIGFILDELLPLIGETERNQIDEHIIEISESDEDY